MTNAVGWRNAFQRCDNLLDSIWASAPEVVPTNFIGGKVLFIFIISQFLTGLSASSQTPVPAWCRPLPRPEYKPLERVRVKDPWFEVYKPTPGVFAIYEPHQAEEVISYLIVGEKRALLFDTGMGISDIKKVTAELTHLPVIVLNSHTHDDHVGGNWQFSTIYTMDTAFTRENAKGSREDAQAEVSPDQICGTLPKGFDPAAYVTRPWKITAYTHDGDKFDLGGRTIEVIATPGHTPDSISLIDRVHGLLFTGDTYYPAPIWLFRPETDFKAYAASISRLNALTPNLRLVLGAHNIPVAKPEVLARLVLAFAAMRKGTVMPTPDSPGKVLYEVLARLVLAFAAMRKGTVMPTPDSPGKVLYKVGDISFLVRAPDSK